MQEISVYDLPSQVPDEALRGCAAVVIDVLRATTTIITALASGALEVRPFLNPEQALSIKQTLPETRSTGSVLLGGERHGVRIDGFDLANSPQDYTPEIIGGKMLLFTTTNGTVAMHAAIESRKILLAGLVNAAAVVRELQGAARIVVICAGTDGFPTDEDRLTAGCLVSRLAKNRNENIRLDGNAVTVKRFWEDNIETKNGGVNSGRLLEIFRQSRGGSNLVELGLDADIVEACRLDSLDTVPVFDAGNQKSGLVFTGPHVGPERLR